MHRDSQSGASGQPFLCIVVANHVHRGSNSWVSHGGSSLPQKEPKSLGVSNGGMITQLGHRGYTDVKIQFSHDDKQRLNPRVRPWASRQRAMGATRGTMHRPFQFNRGTLIAYIFILEMAVPM